MSRLDSFIRRLEAQRACLGHAAALIARVPGPVLELGLGNGRTYDHLRTLLPDREIFAFDRALAAHPNCVPDARHLVLGDFRVSLRAVGLPSPAALVHADTGSGDEAASRALAAEIAPLIGALVARGAVILSDQPMNGMGWALLPPPAGTPHDRYFLYQT